MSDQPGCPCSICEEDYMTSMSESNESQKRLGFDLRTRIAAALADDLAGQLRAAGFDDPAWAADVCDNAATSLMALFAREYKRVGQGWIVRWNSAWTADRATLAGRS